MAIVISTSPFSLQQSRAATVGPFSLQQSKEASYEDSFIFEDFPEGYSDLYNTHIYKIATKMTESPLNSSDLTNVVSTNILTSLSIAMLHRDYYVGEDSKRLVDTPDDWKSFVKTFTRETLNSKGIYNFNSSESPDSLGTAMNRYISKRGLSEKVRVIEIDNPSFDVVQYLLSKGDSAGPVLLGLDSYSYNSNTLASGPYMVTVKGSVQAGYLNNLVIWDTTDETPNNVILDWKKIKPVKAYAIVDADAPWLFVFETMFSEYL